MSLKNPKNLLIIGAVIVALLAGTVLLANYANILPAKSDVSSQVTGSTPCPGAKACPFGRTEPCCAGEAKPGCCPKVCPPDCTKPCCPKLCPPDCTKPCCAGEAAPSGSPMASMSEAANTGCCPKTSNVTE